jgi:hypothetical protein
MLGAPLCNFHVGLTRTALVSVARKLKTYQTSVGFFDLAIAAPSMKAAAEALGSHTDVFRRGFAIRASPFQ